MDYIIGVDIGTTSMKALACQRDGQVVSSVSRSYPAKTDESGRHELEPDLLLGTFVDLVGELVLRMGDRGTVAGVAISCAMHSLIAVSADGRPLTNAITWADLRSKRYAADLKASAVGRVIYRRTGTPIHPMSPLSKLIWLKAESPALFARAAKFVSIKEYIWWRLFGKWQVDHSIASATGLFDIFALGWCEEALGVVGIDAGRLSELVACTHAERELTEEYRRRLGIDGVPFIIGGSDGCLANLGSGVMEEGVAALTIGTSGAIRMTTDVPVYDVGERIFHYVLAPGYYVSGGATNNGAVLLQWWKDVAGDAAADVAAAADAAAADAGNAIADLIEAAALVQPGAEGLVFLPYLQGERAPVWDADAKGVFFGLRSSHGRAHFVRAILEGICCSLYQIGVVLSETVGPVRTIIASGGFTRSAVWVQLVADVFNVVVETTEGADASAVGAAIMGWYVLEGEGLGISLVEAGKRLVTVKERFEPDVSRHAIYQGVFGVYGQLYERLKDLM